MPKKVRRNARKEKGDNKIHKQLKRKLEASENESLKKIKCNENIDATLLESDSNTDDGPLNSISNVDLEAIEISKSIESENNEVNVQNKTKERKRKYACNRYHNDEIYRENIKYQARNKKSTTCGCKQLVCICI